MHIVNNPGRFDVSLCQPEDVVVLIENGVYSTQPFPQQTFLLSADRTARGLATDPSRIDIDYDKFVDLCTQHEKVVSW